MPVKKNPENDPYRLVTHENGCREWIGTPTEVQKGQFIVSSSCFLQSIIMDILVQL